jgi:serine/threonine-protein kinase SRPK3
LQANASKPSRELQILQQLRQKRAAHYIVQLLDSFIHQGHNGCHQCLVFELLGPSVDAVVADYHMGGDSLEASTILRITRQLLKAIASMHAAGYAHGGLLSTCTTFCNISTLISYGGFANVFSGQILAAQT